MPVNQEVELLPSSTITSSANVSVTSNNQFFDGRASSDVMIYLNVSAVSGTSPTLDIKINYLKSGVAYFLKAFTQATATTSEAIEIANCPDNLQMEAVVTGTSPSFTFDIQLTR